MIRGKSPLTQIKETAKFKAALRAVFGLRRTDAWKRAVARGPLAPGETVDVVFEELKLMGIAIWEDNPIDRAVTCFLLAKCPTQVRDQVLLQCGRDVTPQQC